jgi:thioredoxin 1
MSGNILTVSDASFDQDVLTSDVPVLVDYWAEWCGPCRQIAPIVEEISKDYAGRLKVAKMNIEENPLIPTKFNIKAIPTLMIFKEGSEAGRKLGMMSKSQLSAFIDSTI